MKRTKRITALLLTLLLCFSLCGCSIDIDELREVRGYWDADRNILLNGTVYKPLPSCDMLDPTLNTDYDATVYVAEQDVPLLLVQANGQAFSPSTDGVFLVADEYFATTTHYCRSDKYDEVIAQSEAGPELTTYQYVYTTYNEDEFIVEREYTLTAAEAAVLEAVLNEVEWKYSDAGDVYSKYCVTITHSSDNGWFKAPETINIYFDDLESPVFTLERGADYYENCATVEGTHAMAFASLMSTAVEGRRLIQGYWGDEWSYF